ncbi:MAG TPA: hypothetical protein VLI43_10090 [Gemmatimonadaceae bacterium]|nr:hypothetical protein [Gemmatimonadaceae bacterium]
MTHGEREVVRPVSGLADRMPTDDYVIILGEEPKHSAPSLTLAKALAGIGVGVRFVRADRLSRREWVEMVRVARAILLVTYGQVEVYVLSQLATAVAMDVPIVRWWVGTDVLNATTKPEVREHAQRVNRIISANVAVAPHLVEELATIGIDASFVPSVVEPELIPPTIVRWGKKVRPVLIYLPGGRKEFYRIDLMEAVIASNPDLEFIVVADQTHALALYPNVESLGWVADMRPHYDRAGCVLRMTAHDGLPRMLLEALLRGLYAIYSWPLEGCWQARTPEETAFALARYRQMKEPNMYGRESVLEMLRTPPEEKISSVLSDSSVPLPRRAHALGLAVRTKMFPAQFS